MDDIKHKFLDLINKHQVKIAKYSKRAKNGD